MALWIVLGFTFLTAITIVLLTIFLSYYKKAYQCDSAPDIFCFTDWQCDAGVTTAQYGSVEKGEMSCFLKALYSAIRPSDNCGRFLNRSKACTDPNDPSQTSVCTEDGEIATTGWCGCGSGANNNAAWAAGCDLDSGCTDIFGPNVISISSVACAAMANLFKQKPCSDDDAT